MTIGLICAIPQELAHLKAALEQSASVAAGGAQYDHGRLDGHDVVLVGAGIGKVNTRPWWRRCSPTGSAAG